MLSPNNEKDKSPLQQKDKVYNLIKALQAQEPGEGSGCGGG